MNQALLRTFLAIVETGNLKRAADRLHVSQSTVSSRLDHLEQELGQALFHRHKSGAELTSAGFKFERYAQLMTALWRQARQETSLPSDVDTVLNLGCDGDLWPGIGDLLFQKIREQRSGIALSAWQGGRAELGRWLSSGLIDAAICYASVLPGSWDLRPLMRDRLLLVSTRRRALMRWDPEYVYVDFGEEFRREHAAAYPDGDTPMTVFSSPIWALNHLRQYGGSAYLPKRLIEEQLRDRRLYRVPKAPEFTREVYLAVTKPAGPNPHWLVELCDSSFTN